METVENLYSKYTNKSQIGVFCPYKYIQTHTHRLYEQICFGWLTSFLSIFFSRENHILAHRFICLNCLELYTIWFRFVFRAIRIHWIQYGWISRMTGFPWGDGILEQHAVDNLLSMIFTTLHQIHTNTSILEKCFSHAVYLLIGGKCMRPTLNIHNTCKLCYSNEVPRHRQLILATDIFGLWKEKFVRIVVQ